MTEAVIIALIVNVCATIGLTVKAIFDYKKSKPKKNNSSNSKKNNPSNSNAVPSFLCFAHGEKLTKLEMKLNTACENIRDMKHEIERLKDRIG